MHQMRLPFGREDALAPIATDRPESEGTLTPSFLAKEKLLPLQPCLKVLTAGTFLDCSRARRIVILPSYLLSQS